MAATARCAQRGFVAASSPKQQLPVRKISIIKFQQIGLVMKTTHYRDIPFFSPNPEILLNEHARHFIALLVFQSCFKCILYTLLNPITVNIRNPNGV